MKAPFRLPSRPDFPNDLKVLLLESSADQPAVAEQLRNLSYTGGPTTSDAQWHSMRLIVTDSVSHKSASSASAQAYDAIIVSKTPSECNCLRERGASLPAILLFHVVGILLHMRSCARPMSIPLTA